MTAAKKQEATKPVAQPAVTPEAQPQPTAPAPAAPAVAAPVATTPSKQTATLKALKLAWEKRGVDLKALKATPDGKFLNVVVGEGWPLIRIGTGGGIDLPQVKSYPKAFDAAVNGDTLLKKQQERLTKTATTAPATTAAKPEEKKAVTPAAKKQEQHAQLEQKLENRA